MALTFAGNILSKISFCDKQCDNVNDNKIKSEIIKNIDSKHKIQVITRDYSILNPNIFRNVSYHQHIISTYTNGNPYMLYLTKIDGINQSIFIDKKLKDGYTYPKIHCVKYRFSDELFEKETIFTGELVRDNDRRWFFLIDNILIYKGMSTSDKNILSKFDLIYNIMSQEYNVDNYLEICPLQVKKLFLYKDIKLLINDFIPNLSYKCNGLNFYTLNTKNSNYAYLLPRDCQIEIKSSSDIEDMINEKCPELINKNESIDKQSNYASFNTSINISDDVSRTIEENLSGNLSGNLSENVSANVSENVSGNLSENVSENLSETVSEKIIACSIIEQNNVVFKILKSDIPDIYSLYCLDENNNLIKHSNALIPNIKTSHLLYNAFLTNPNNFDMNIECKYSNYFEKWKPYKFVKNTPYNKKIISDIEDKLKNKEQ